MVELNQVINGLKAYLESELVSRVTGLEKWVVGAGLSMLLDNGINTFNVLKENEFIKAMEIVNRNDEIDIDRLYKYLSEQAKKSAVTFKVPLIGSVTLKAEDVEKIYTSIKGASK